MKMLRTVGCCLVGVAISLTSLANVVVAPDELIRETTQLVLAEIKNEKSELKQDSDKLFAFVDKTVLPHFDFERMSKWVLGKYWRKFSDEQQVRFVAEFRYLLVKTYGLALLEYNDQQVTVQPASIDAEGGTSSVKTEIIQSGAPPVAIDYRLYQDGNQAWKVYDITIEGISLVANYRSSFSSLVRNNGPEGLLQYLIEKNGS